MTLFLVSNICFLLYFNVHQVYHVVTFLYTSESETTHFLDVYHEGVEGGGEVHLTTEY